MKEKFVVRILKGVNDPHDKYFDNLIEAKIFAHHNGGNVWQLVTMSNNDYYWKKV